MMQFSNPILRSLCRIFLGTSLLIAGHEVAPAAELSAFLTTDRGCEGSLQQPIRLAAGTQISLQFRVSGVDRALVTLERIEPGTSLRLFQSRIPADTLHTLPHVLAPLVGPHRFRLTAEAPGQQTVQAECGVTVTADTGTGGGVGTPAGPPRIEVTPAIVEFGEAPVGEIRRRVVTLRNQGGAPLQISPVRLRRGAASPFNTCGLDAVAFTIPPGDVRRLLFCFTPIAGGPTEDVLEIPSNDPEKPIVPITLRGSAPGAPGTIAVPLLRMTGASNPSGTGGGRFRSGEPVTIQYGVEAQDSVSLRLESGNLVTPLVTGQSVRAGETYTLEARTPETPGAWQLILARTAAAPGRRLGFLVARGPRLEVTAPAFPEGPAGQTRRQTFLLRNAGIGTLEVDPPALLVGPCSSFSLCDGSPRALSLPAGGPPVPLEICFTPRTAGEFQDLLLLASNDPDQPLIPVPLTGRATGAAPSDAVGAASIHLSVDPPTTRDELSLRISGVNWPNTCFPVSRASIVRDGSPIVINLTAGPSCPPPDCEAGRFPWSVAPESVGTVAEGRYEVIVTYYGQVIGRRHFWVFAPDQRPAIPPAVAGGIPQIEVTPEPLDLGDVAVGATGQQSIMVRNTGTGPLAVGAARIEGGRPADGRERAAFSFCAGPPASFELSPGESREIRLCFSPADPCPFDATLVIPSSDPDEPAIAIPLSGRSTAGAPVLGQPFRGSLRAAGETNTYCVALEAGDRLLARVSRASGEFLPAVCLETPLGADPICWARSVPFELPSPALEGLYRLRIGGESSAPGDYGLYLQRLNRPENAVPLASNGPAMGEIARPAEMDAYTFTGTAGESIRLRITRTGGSFRPAIRLYSPEGILVGQSWQPGGAEMEIVETLPATGAYTVLIDDGAEDATGGTLTGTYTLTLGR